MAYPSKASVRPVPPAPSSSHPQSGFRANLRGADLPDLVQLACLSRERKVVRVTSAGITGYLYFSEGRIVDALARDLEGRAAALEILGWREGAFEPVDLAWSGRETITDGWQGLLLEAMQQRDEREVGTVVAFPHPAGTPDSSIQSTSSSDDLDFAFGNDLKEAPPVQRLVPPVKSIPAQPLPFGSQFTAAVRVTPEGSISASQGDADGLAGVAALAERLSQLVGEQLAIDPFVALECTFESGSCILYAESGGDIVAVQPAVTADISDLRRQLGL